MIYQVPPNVACWMKNDKRRQRIRELLTKEETTGCSLQNLEKAIMRIIRDGNVERKELSGVRCVALPQQLCYLVKGTEKHPQVSSRDECLVYQEVTKQLRNYTNT